MDNKGGGAKRSRAKKRAAGTAPSEKLLIENKQMEWQLHQLRSTLERERARGFDERALSGESSIWKSGASTTGSLRSYGRQVLQRKDDASASTKHVVDGSHGGKGVLSKSSPAKKRILRGSEAACWSKEDVQLWLESVQLGSLKALFNENEIDGEVLLELGVDDLDYMGISALGPRKNLLKQVARLKRCVEQISQPRNRVSAGASSQLSHNRAAISANAGQQSQQYQALDLPISDEPAKKTSIQYSADLELDEAAEHEAFRKAVEEWRNGGKVCTSKNDRETKESGDSTYESCADISPSGGGGSLGQGSLDENKEHQAFLAAVKQWRAGSGGAVEVVHFKTLKADELAAKQARTAAMLQAFEERLQVRSAWPEACSGPEQDLSTEEEGKTSLGGDEESVTVHGARESEPHDSPQFDIKAWNFDSVF